jgi:hypothetical protein
MAVGEWDQRQLCPDGGCVGVIGPDGTCKVCGRAAQNWGDERKRGLIDDPSDEDEDDEDDEDDDLAADEDDDLDDEDEDDDEDADDEDDEGDADDEDDEDADDGDVGARVPAVAAASSRGEWGSRQLCPDGSCIGVIGADGTCKVCGRTASGARGGISGPAAVVAAEPAPGDEPSDPAGDPPPGDAAPPAEPAATQHARCADPACSGMIGLDGQCEVCGKVGA